MYQQIPWELVAEPWDSRCPLWEPLVQRILADFLLQIAILFRDVC
jgi:hypothetical protein